MIYRMDAGRRTTKVVEADNIPDGVVKFKKAVKKDFPDWSEEDIEPTDVRLIDETIVR